MFFLNTCTNIIKIKYLCIIKRKFLAINIFLVAKTVIKILKI